MPRGHKRPRVVLSDEESVTARPSKSGNTPLLNSDSDSDVPMSIQKQPRLADVHGAAVKSKYSNAKEGHANAH